MKGILQLATVALLALAVASGAEAQHGAHAHGHAQDGPAKIKPGDKVPNFTVTDLHGQKRTLAELRADKKLGPDGLIVFTYWCSFCHSCRDIEADLDKLAREFKGKAAIFALDASAGESAEKVTAFAKRQGLTVPVMLDPDAKSADLLGVRVTTTTFVVDAKGVVRYRGQFSQGSKAYAAAALKAVLAGKEVTVPSTRDHG